jgi:hypothetical protein
MEHVIYTVHPILLIQWGEYIFFNLRNPSGRTRPWGLLSR